MTLVNELIKFGWLKSPHIIDAFSDIARKDFLLKEVQDKADLNYALSIGHNQTISQPMVVAFMLEQLQPQRGNKVLDIGAGSGWTAALLAYIVGETGKVVALEIIEELVTFGKENVEKYDYISKGIVEFLKRDANEGYTVEAPYDRILVSASLPEKILPEAWKEQLSAGGRIVVPIKNSIWTFVKKLDGSFSEKEYPGFTFVPFVSP